MRSFKPCLRFVEKYFVEVSLPMKITKRKWNAILLVDCYDLTVKFSVFCQQTLTTFMRIIIMLIDCYYTSVNLWLFNLSKSIISEGHTNSFIHKSTWEWIHWHWYSTRWNRWRNQCSSRQGGSSRAVCRNTSWRKIRGEITQQRSINWPNTWRQRSNTYPC